MGALLSSDWDVATAREPKFRREASGLIAAFEGEQELSIHERIARALKKAEAAVDSGATTELLQRWISLTQSLVAPS